MNVKRHAVHGQLLILHKSCMQATCGLVITPIAHTSSTQDPKGDKQIKR